MAVLDAFHEVVSQETPAPERLKRRLDYCCTTFQACHYTALARELPGLLIGARAAAAAASLETRCEAYGTLSRTYQLAASYLQKFGAATVSEAAVAADRALATAELAADPVAVAAASRRVAKSLAQQGRTDTAVTLAVNTANRLRSELEQRGAEGLSTLGMLYLTAAIAVTGNGRSRDGIQAMDSLIAAAQDAAEQQGADLNADWTSFGPTNVGLHRVDALVRVEDGWSALDAHTALAPQAVAVLPRERQAQHLITVARASLLTRRKEAAVSAVLNAERLAPEEVRSRPSVLALVGDLLVVSPVPSGPLRALAGRCGLRA
ncbi:MULTISPECIES: DNA-binding protein [Streptomyces]|uniref:DNA-binding protein n=1 Tax=Streptomyces TaxID=1883 RepID=UPI0022491821|nr:DNA-binding protein [Streptomyces sp. JHD 1]MCX2970725.1 DNA-binding protein [Streptomyces sp. JHD 1]